MKVSDFVIATKEIDGIVENSVGLIKSISDNSLQVFFVGAARLVKVQENDLEYLDVTKTGKPNKTKICNICHILKNRLRDFNINQTDAKGRKTARPSCKVCRIKITGAKMNLKAKQKFNKTKPTLKSIFKCPICQKVTIAGITAKLVRDHDHKTGKARGWICDSCNTGLGRFKDDVVFIQRILGYLKKHG